MLAYLRIRGLALLDDVTLELAPGMNVLTGETGAGKSIIVDALALVRGGRARADLVRAGAESCVVDAQFELPDAVVERVASVLVAHGLPASEAATLVLQRTAPRSGRGRCLVQAELTTQQVMAQVGEQLIEICSQHEHHALTRVGRHVELLDDYAGLQAELAAYAETYGTWRTTLRDLEQLRKRAVDGAARADYLRFQLDELERVAPLPGEVEELRKRVALLRDASAWADYASELHYALDEAEDAISGRLAALHERARRGVESSERLAQICDQLAAARAACEEADHQATRFASELEFDPDDLGRAEERLHDLVSLQRKHGTIDDLGQLAAKMRDELAALEHAGERVAALETGAEEHRQRALEGARALRTARKRASRELSRVLEAELAALHLGGARLEAKLEELADGDLGPRGIDRVEFLFSANPGEPLAALTRVASGGELSRVLLALKGVLATNSGVSTYVFDEVDAGVGGAVAVAIAQRLARAARSSQVLCITHLPQIAAYASAHFHVTKHASKERTITRVTRLTDEQRIEELARMLGGARVTDSAREHARQLLEEARRSSEPALTPPTRVSPIAIKRARAARR